MPAKRQGVVNKIKGFPFQFNCKGKLGFSLTPISYELSLNVSVPQFSAVAP